MHEKTANEQTINDLLQEIDSVDRETFELKKEIQHKGCPFCDSCEGDFIENYFANSALFYKFKKCSNCLLIYPYPRVKKDIFEGYFKAKLYGKRVKEGSIEPKVKRNPLKELLKKYPLSYSQQEFKRFLKKGDRVLEVGAGGGELTKQLIDKGCIIEVVEINPYRAEYLRKTLGIKVYNVAFSDAQLQHDSYDAVVFSHVLMHLFSIKEALQKVQDVLRVGGLLISSQMNFNSVIQKTVRSPFPGKGLTAFSISSWFTPESMRNILMKSGFEIVDTIFIHSGLFRYIFVEGYPGNYLTRLCLHTIEQVLKLILIKTGTSDYFTVIARKK